jgi:hypothetical protein
MHPIRAEQLSAWFPEMKPQMRGRYFLTIVTCLLCLFSAPASATFTAYRFAQNYIVIGTDSREIGAWTDSRSSDRNCKITLLDDAHFFAGEGISRLLGQLSMDELAKRVFDANPTASTGDLAKKWVAESAAQLKQVYGGHPEAIPAQEPFPLTKGFFGEVRASGSAWSAGMVAMNQDRATWKLETVTDQGPRDDFLTQSDDRELAAQFDWRIPATENIDVDAATMRRLVQFVIENTAHSYVGGVPEVVALEYGKPVRWYAGADICGAKKELKL